MKLVAVALACALAVVSCGGGGEPAEESIIVFNPETEIVNPELEFAGHADDIVRANADKAREVLAVLELMQPRKLARFELKAQSGLFCTMGAVLAAKGFDLPAVGGYRNVAGILGWEPALVSAIMGVNDDGPTDETPEQRWLRMVAWLRGLNLVPIFHHIR